MSTQRIPDLQAPDPQVLDMLAGLNTSASLAAVQRTRRAVMQAASEMREQRRRNRRNIAFVSLVFIAICALLTPAIWSTLDDYFAGDHFFEWPEMITVLALVLFSAVVGVLLISFKDNGPLHFGRHERR
jgi:cytochrome bd-type quinol oxidase subunit 2